PWAGYVGGSGDFLPQLGSNETINAVDHRMENVVFRNNKLWATHHIFLPANNPQRTSVQWWNISPTGEIIQHGRVDDPTGEMSYAFASLALNQFEDMLIGFNIFSENQYASAGYAYRAHFDPLNTTRAPFQFKDGLAPYYKTFGSGRNRWGDYSATMLDPVNSVDFWTIQQYAELPSSGDRWGTWWAYLRIPFEPIADFAVNETLIPLGESINFSDKSIGIPQEWNWIFEGGIPQQSTDQNPAGITFNNEGVFNVSLTVTNQFGTNTITKNSLITVSSTLLPDVAFAADKNLICTGGQVNLFDQSLYMPRAWEWEIIPSTISFVNGTDAFSQNPQVVFHEQGDYTVKLTAANLNGEADLTEFNFIRVGGRDVPFAEFFESETFSENYWTIVNPDNKKTWELTHVGGLNETTVAAQLDFMTYVGSVGQRDRLITPPFDLRG
ncbi:MAG: PKD domain-containing protein, partial [Bacteroidales bacterium]|nr:PKD domain-containing protein [Bacteroidales bacterium]